MNIRQDFDIDIIGGSFAGSAAAWQAARAGYSVAVLDRAHFPRRKACGEGISKKGWQALIEIGVDRARIAAHSVKLSGYEVAVANSKLGAQPFSVARKYAIDAEAGSVYGVNRRELEQQLREHAEQSGCVIFIDGFEIQTIEKTGDGWLVGCGEYGIYGSQLVLADGSRSTSAEIMEIPSTAVANPRVGYSIVVSGEFLSQQTSVKVVKFPGIDLFCTPISTTLLNISMVGRGNAMRQLRRKETQVIDVASAHSNFRLTKIIESAGSSQVSSARRTHTFNGALLCGDCLETFDPVGGMGMTHAIISGQLAGESAAALVRGESQRIVFNRYFEQLESEARLMRGYTRLCYLGVSHSLSRIVLPLSVKSGLAATLARQVHSGSGKRHLLNLTGLARTN